jgi:Pex14 N-terminal domain
VINVLMLHAQLTAQPACTRENRSVFEFGVTLNAVCAVVLDNDARVAGKHQLLVWCALLVPASFQITIMKSLAVSLQVESGVRFLQHPQAQASPLSQRISFLEKKGLTSEEISEALTRAEGGTGAAFGDIAVEDPEPLWRKLLLPGALIAAGLGVVGATRARDSNAFSRGPGLLNSAAAGQHGADNPDRSLSSIDADEAALAAADPAARQQRQSAAAEPAAAQSSSEEASAMLRLAEAFSKLSTAMTTQSAQLGQAIESMKTLAARADREEQVCDYSFSLTRYDTGGAFCRLQADCSCIALFSLHNR